MLLYKQLIRPLIDNACPIWRSAPHTHVRRLHMLQSKCFPLVTGAPWYLSNRQIHKELGVPLFDKGIRSLTASFDSRLTGVGNHLVRHLARYLCWTRAGLSSRRVSLGQWGQQAGRGHRLQMAKSTNQLVLDTDNTRTFRIPWLRTFRDFSPVVRQMPGL
jgi:hypothetical protein